MCYRTTPFRTGPGLLSANWSGGLLLMREGAGPAGGGGTRRRGRQRKHTGTRSNQSAAGVGGWGGGLDVAEAPAPRPPPRPPPGSGGGSAPQRCRSARWSAHVPAEPRPGDRHHLPGPGVDAQRVPVRTCASLARLVDGRRRRRRAQWTAVPTRRAVLAGPPPGLPPDTGVRLPARAAVSRC